MTIKRFTSTLIVAQIIERLEFESLISFLSYADYQNTYFLLITHFVITESFLLLYTLVAISSAHKVILYNVLYEFNLKINNFLEFMVCVECFTFYQLKNEHRPNTVG